MIIMTTDAPIRTPGQFKRLKRIVEQNMKDNRQSGRSASGATALIAIQWCEARGLQWRLTGSHSLGYFVEIADNAAVDGQRA